MLELKQFHNQIYKPDGIACENNSLENDSVSIHVQRSASCEQLPVLMCGVKITVIHLSNFQILFL